LIWARTVSSALLGADGLRSATQRAQIARGGSQDEQSE
jgi:hypothetical protein